MKQLSVLACVSTEIILPRHSVELVKPGHQCSGTDIGSPTRLLSHSRSYGNTGDGMLGWVMKSVTSRKARPKPSNGGSVWCFDAIIPCRASILMGTKRVAARKPHAATQRHVRQKEGPSRHRRESNNVAEEDGAGESVQLTTSVS